MGPRAASGCTGNPRWQMWSRPSSASARAAARTGSISARQSPSLRLRATSDGQAVVEAPRCCSRAIMAARSSRSPGVTPVSCN